MVCFHSWYVIFFLFFDSAHDKIYVDIYLKIFGCILISIENDVHDLWGEHKRRNEWKFKKHTDEKKYRHLKQKKQKKQDKL